MLSRVADHLYWLSRYLERAEHTARLLEISVTLSADRTPESASRQGVRILSALQALDAQRAGHGRVPAARHRPRRRRARGVAAGVRVACARERPAGARADQRGHVGGAQPALPAPAGRARGSRLAGAARGPVPGRPPLRLPVQGHDQLHDGAGRGLAVHGAGALPRALDQHLDAARRAPARVPRQPAHGRSRPPSTSSGCRSCAAVRPSTPTCGHTRPSIRPLHVHRLPRARRRSSRGRCASPPTASRSRSSASSRLSGRTQPARVERLAGLLRASLQFVQIEELLHGDLLQTLEHVRRQCRLIHHATYQSYISYQLESEIA